MKSIVSIFCTVIITFCLTAFSYSTRYDQASHNVGGQPTEEMEPPTFYYNLSSYNMNTISKERIHNANTVSDLIPEHTIQENLKNNMLSLRDVRIVIKEENAQGAQRSTEKSVGNYLNTEQINLLQSTEYSTNLSLKGYVTDKNTLSNQKDDRYFNYQITVVPEQQASYKSGKKSLIDFLQTQCRSTINKVQGGILEYGKISFTVTIEGSISNISIKSTCGYPSVDKRMLELMDDLPDGWNVATNRKGEKVSQTLIYSFGKAGC